MTGCLRLLALALRAPPPLSCAAMNARGRSPVPPRPLAPRGPRRPTLLRAAPALACLCGALALAGAGAPREARAAEPDPAEIYFERGLDHMEAKRYEAACPAIEESYKLDPRPGTLFTLAECEALRGRLATAIARYDEYLAVHNALPDAQKRKQGDRAKVARAQRDALAREVPQVTLVLPPDAPEGTTVERDGVAVPAESISAPVPLDPGEHVIKARAPGGAEVELRVRVGKGEKKTLTLELKAGPEAAPEPAPAPAPAPPPVTRAPEPAPPPDSGPSGRRVAAYVAGGLGLAGLALGGVTGTLAIGQKGTVDEHCDGAACDHEGKEAADKLQGFGLVSTIGFAVGAAGVGAAAVLLLTEPDRPADAAARARPRLRAGVAPGPGGMAFELRGTW